MSFSVLLRVAILQGCKGCTPRHQAPHFAQPSKSVSIAETQEPRSASSRVRPRFFFPSKSTTYVETSLVTCSAFWGRGVSSQGDNDAFCLCVACFQARAVDEKTLAAQAKIEELHEEQKKMQEEIQYEKEAAEEVDIWTSVNGLSLWRGRGTTASNENTLQQGRAHLID